MNTSRSITASARIRPVGRRARRAWLVAAAAAITVSLVPMLLGSDALVNLGGWPSLRAFLTAAIAPDLSPAFLGRVLDATVVTLAFSLLGTTLAVLGGLIGGVLVSRTWWEPYPTAGPTLRPQRQAGWGLARVLIGVPRGVHEAVWAMGLLLVLGRDPVVGVLALAIPFGAITATVYANTIDELPRAPYRALRLAGAPRWSAMLHGVLPRARGDLISYAFYRLDCAVRSAVILGMLGAGGLGFELLTAFQGLAFARMWTVIWALVLVGVVLDRWSAWLRRGGARVQRVSVVIGAVLTVAALLRLGLGAERLLEASTWRRAGALVADAVPPSLPLPWPELAGAAVVTLQMSVLAIALGAAIGLLLALAAVPDSGAAGRARRPLRSALASLSRGIMVLLRAVSPPVWALLVLLVVVPGVLPGAIALGVYNAGVLGRLFAEVLEEMDRTPVDALRRLGAGPVAAFCLGTMPLALGRLTAYGLYRWEVAIRETVVVGVVGAGGLGRVLESQRAAFDMSGMLTVVLLLLGLSVAVDLLSGAARRALR